MDQQTIDFIAANENADVVKLLLSASKYRGVDIPLAAQCIQARAKIKTKIPLWHAHPELVFPISLALEQCSSQATALYKQRFVACGNNIADLTGGLGVDSFFFSLKCASVDYFERNPSLALAAKVNFSALHADNIYVLNRNISISLIENKEFKPYDLIFLDPARRGKKGEKIYSVKECEPDILSLKEALFEKTETILIKISPMADISATFSLLPETKEVHILSVDNECKEVLLLLKKSHTGEPEIIASNITKSGTVEFRFYPQEEKTAECRFAAGNDLNISPLYLFEPNRSILKSGAFKLAAARYGLVKLAPSTHLYIGSEPISDYPGKLFKIDKILDLDKQAIKTIAESYPEASVSSRNFPISSDELRKRLKISESDRYHIFATTLAGNNKILIITEKISYRN